MEILAGLRQINHSKIQMHFLFLQGVTDEALIQLSKGCPNLRTICMSNCGVTDNGIRILSAACKDVQNIEVAQCSQLTDSAFLALAKNCTKVSV